MQLVTPSSIYKDSFLRAVIEYQKKTNPHSLDILELSVATLHDHFEDYVKSLKDESQGIGLPKGYVPQTTYWLIDKNEFIGRVRIRHRLIEQLLKEGGHIGYDIRPSKRKMGYGKKILALALPKTKELGITKALITCDETNIGSKKIIESNGGVFENSVIINPKNPKKLRYWIQLS